MTLSVYWVEDDEADEGGQYEGINNRLRHGCRWFSLFTRRREEFWRKEGNAIWDGSVRGGVAGKTVDDGYK